MMWQTFATLALCYVLKGKVAEDWENGTGALNEDVTDGLLVASQFLGLFVLALKRGRREAGQNLVAVLPVLEEGESKIVRLEREKTEGQVREREALEEKAAALLELLELKKKNYSVPYTSGLTEFIK